MSFSVVPDTNVVIARALTKHPKSPNQEFFRRFKDGEFEWLYSNDTLLEYIRKLTELGLEPDWIEQFIANIIVAANAVNVPIIHFHLEIYPVDERDICFLLCAINGKATHIVTYDIHFLSIADEIKSIFSIEVCKPIDFLKSLRKRKITLSHDI